MFKVFILTIFIVLGTQLDAGGMNTVFKQVDSTNIDNNNTKPDQSSASRLFGNSSSHTSDDSPSERKESATVFGRTMEKEERTRSTEKGHRSSSVFGTDRSVASKGDADQQDHGRTNNDPENPRSAPNYMWPVNGGTIVSFYGWRSGRRFHDGIDIKAPSGTEVYASKSGEVIYSDRKIRGYGNMVVIRHNSGYSTVYAHNKKNLVKHGDIVKQGDVIAYVGNTGHSSGPHSHFEVRKGKYSVDPLKYLNKRDIKEHSGAYQDSPGNPF